MAQLDIAPRVAPPSMNGRSSKGRASVKPPAPQSVTGRQKDVLARLGRLRSATKEVSRSYVANVERDIVEITDLIGAARDRSGRRKKINPAAFNAMTEIFDDLSLKPEKGRRSDLKKIEKAVRAMRRVLAKEKL